MSDVPTHVGPERGVDGSAQLSLATPVGARDAGRLLAVALGEHRRRVRAASDALAAAEKQRESAVRSARVTLREAGGPKTISTLGLVGRVTLTETAVKTPKGYMVLTPEVHAHAEQHGNKQVVQGWAFKSDNDRREIYLHIDGPSQSIVVPYQLKNRAIEPAQVHALAAAINTAAHTA